MKLSEKIKELDFKGRDFPIIAGTVKFKLHNVHNGKDEVVEEHNMATNALKDIFTMADLSIIRTLQACIILGLGVFCSFKTNSI